MSRRAIVGIVGKKGTGKTEVANYLVSYYNFIERAFGDKLKEIAADMFDVPLEVFYTRDGKNVPDERWQMTHRQMLQRLGTEIGRTIHSGMWVYHVRKWLDERPEQDVVLSDVRFHTEAEMIREAGGRIWKLVRDTGSEDNHLSETEQDGIEPDVLIHNGGSISDLHFMIDEAVKRDISWKRKN